MHHRFVFRFLFFSLLSFLSFVSQGQEIVDTIYAENYGGRENYLHWKFIANLNQPAKSIGIQRADDSTAYYSTIGHASNPEKEINQFVDKEPSNLQNSYRLFILFQDGSYAFSKPTNVIIIPKTEAAVPSPGSNIPTPFQPSIYVYTNPDGNVNISIVDSKNNDYAIRFFDSTHQFLFEVNRIKKPLLIIDKANFLHTGWFYYEIYKNGKIFEKWKFYISE